MTVEVITTTIGLVSPAGTAVATLKHLEVEWTQDEGASPSVIATVTVVAPTALQFAMMRPGAGYYLSIDADRAGTNDAPILLKIADRSRTLDGRVRLQATSPELDLQSYTPSAVDRSNWARQSSVRTILTDVFSKVWSNWATLTYTDGFGQDWGTPAYRTYSPATNLCTNGGFEYGVTGWEPGYSYVTASTSQKHSGVYSMLVEPANPLAARATLAQNLQPATKYTLSAWVRSSGVMTGLAVNDGRRLYVVGTSGGVVTRLASTTMAPNVANQWNRVSVTFTTPALMDSGTYEVRALNGTTSANPVNVWFDDILLVEGDAREADGATLTYFDGDTVDGTGGYNYDWQGDAGTSSSSRTPIIDRDPETLTWSPGQSAWDFITPMLQALGLRVWTPDYRIYQGSVAAVVCISKNEFGFNLRVTATDTTNLFELEQIDSYTATFPDGLPMYADQVIIHYTWKDNLGVDQEKYDVYPSTGKKPYVLELEDTAFAGTGRAQGIYNRLSARATMLSGTTTYSRAMLPGVQMALTAAVLGGSVVGYLDSVTWNPINGTCQFRTKQTIAYTSTSWYAATGTWAAQTGSWANDI